MSNKMKQLFSLFLVSVAIIAPSAFAVLDPGIATGVTTVQTDGLELQSLFWPAVIAITGGFVMFKLFKRGARQV